MKLIDLTYNFLFSNRLFKKILIFKPVKNAIRFNAGFLNYYFIKDFKINNLRFEFSPKLSKDILFNGDFFLGLYEKEERFFCEKYLTHKDNVLEIGGGFGVISSVIKNQIKEGRLVVIEANYKNIHYIKKNLKNNNFNDVKVENVFISNSSGKTKFYLNESFLRSSSKLKTKNEVLVNNVKLKDIFREYKNCFNTLVIDIEGGEIELFEENLELITKFVSKIIIEVHPKILGNLKTNEFIKNIKKNYKLKEFKNDVFYFEKIEK